MKKGIVFAALLSAAFLSVNGQELNFDKALAKLPASLKKVISADTQCKVSAKHSYRIEKGYMLNLKVALKPNSKYELTYMVKGKDLAAKGEGGRIMLNNGKFWMRIVSSPKGEPESGTFDWRKGKEIIDTSKFTAPETMFILSCGKTGTIWYDKVELKKIK